MRELTQSHDRVAEQMRALEQRAEGLDRRYAELTRVFDGAVSKIDRIGADVQSVAAHDSRLQPALTAAHQRLTSHRGEMETIRRELTRFQYELLIPRVRTMVEAAIPAGAIALVVSKGDERLLAFSGRTGWHFLRNDRASTPAIIPPTAPPRSRRSSDCVPTAPRYLVIPQVALWWLDHYAGLREHLDKHATRGRAE